MPLLANVAAAASRIFQFARAFHVDRGGLRIERLFVGALTIFLIATSAFAERLPTRQYTTTDGLPSNTITCVKRDTRGFLWFCTAEGLARFDGYTFVTYGVEQGLPDQFITDLLETRNGDYWVGTFRGLARFNPQARTSAGLFTRYRVGATESDQHVNSLFEDRDGVLWVATDGGVFSLDRSARTPRFRLVEIGHTVPQRVADFIVQDHTGNLWITVGRDEGTALYRRSPDGRSELLHDPFFANNRVLSLLVDSSNRIWLGSYRGLALFAEHPADSKVFSREFTTKDGLPKDYVSSLFESSDGRLWLASGGLIQVLARHGKFQFNLFAKKELYGIDTEDSNGNFWMANMRYAPHGFVTYDREDGLRTYDIRSIFEGHDGQLYVVTGTHGRYIHRFDGQRFRAVAPLVPGHAPSWDWGGWGWGQTHLQDRNGEWWFATHYGLFRYPKVHRLEDLAHTPPSHIYTSRDGLGGDDVFRLYEDSHGDIWVSAWGGLGLSRWDRATEHFHTFLPQEHWWGVASAIREDRSGNIWLGSWEHDLVRYRQGAFERLRTQDGFPDGLINSIFLDHLGRIWAGTSRGGLVRIDEPGADRVQFRVYSTKDGLSSNNVRAITEDRWGRIYFWTGKGIDRLEPNSGAVVHYTTEDGLVPAGSDNQEAFCDRQGNLWFGFNGLSRLEPQPEPTHRKPLPVYITSVRVDGMRWPTSELGEASLTGLVLQPNQNDLQIGFGTINFDTKRVPRYQYMLQGADNDWSPPTDLRVVNYANMRPGTYRFFVRVIDSEGQISRAPAVLGFRLLAPIWARWWFLSLLAIAAALVAYGIDRYRVNRLLELERVRTRIASDLHDDIGSGLTQIAILSEVVRQQKSAAGSEQLSRIADLSRELVDGMGEIVWALNPERDQLVDLVQRMRRFASDVFVSRGIEFDFEGPITDSHVPLRSDLRRQVYLIFKEAINNSVRHSGCTRASISISAENKELALEIEDNGEGIATDEGGESDGSGHGLNSMKKRAADAGGTLQIESSPGTGTRILLRMPLPRPIRRQRTTT